jgi:hypothetical protein
VFVPPLIRLAVGGLTAVLMPITQAGFKLTREFVLKIVDWVVYRKAVAFIGSST